MDLVDTHCHIQFDDYKLAPDDVIERANQAGVNTLLCVGCTLKDSQQAVLFAREREGCWASIGIHPHEASHYVDDQAALKSFSLLADEPKVIAVGECGIDYYYNHSPKTAQIRLLEYQLDLAQRSNLPVIFHVRDAFSDFWSILDNFPGTRGVIHSFTAGQQELEEILKRNLLVGLNGILTFTKDEKQLEVVRLMPLDNILLETDAPYLTPVPFRGKICEPKHVRTTAEFLATLRGCELETLAAATTRNAKILFGI